MKTEIYQQKLTRYVNGRALPAEKKQIENWLSVVDKSALKVSEPEKETIRAEILREIQDYTAYPLFFPRPRPWWKRIITRS
ncbi:MAG TPA: hypothetical protein VG870_01995 [Chitinophagaceae bacterium]|nr:hypothetical protein [Chitinophagaceae bacterium]